MPDILQPSTSPNFSVEGHHENVHAFVGVNSGASGIYIADESKATADILSGCCGCIPEWSHLWEHYGCTQDQRNLNAATAGGAGAGAGAGAGTAAAALQTSRVQHFRSTIAIGSQQTNVALKSKLQSKTNSALKFQTLTLTKALEGSKKDRFTPEIQTNASTRDHYVEFHMSGCASKASVKEQWSHLAHQFLGIQSANAVDEKTVMREAAAVRNEASRCLSAIPYLMSELSKMVDLRHHLDVREAVIGRNVLGEGAWKNMADIEDRTTVMREMKKCADHMVPSRTSWVYHGPSHLMSLDEFKGFFATTDQLFTPKVPTVPDSEFLTPLVKEEYLGSASRTCVLPNENGFNVMAHSFTGALATSNESVAYSLLTHLWGSDGIKGVLQQNRCISFFDCMFERVGRRPQVITMYNVAMPGSEAKVTNAFYQLAAPKQITPEVFNTAKHALIQKLEEWRSMPNLNNVLPDTLAAHPCGAMSIMTLFQHEKLAKDLTYENFMKLYSSQIYRRLTQSTMIHGISESLLQEAHYDIKETPLKFKKVPDGPQFSQVKWQAPHVTVAGSNAFLVLRTGIKDKLTQSYIATQLAQRASRTWQCTAAPNTDFLQFTIKSPMEDLETNTQKFVNMWNALKKPADAQALQMANMQMMANYSNAKWCADTAVQQATSVAPVEPAAPGKAASFNAPVEVVYFLPKLITGNKSTAHKCVSKSQNLLRANLTYSTTPTVAPLFDPNGKLLLNVAQCDWTHNDNTVHEVKVPCQNIEFRCVVPCANFVNRRSALEYSVIAQYLGGGWNSAGMQVMRRSLNHCYDYSAHLHLPMSSSDVPHITMQSEFRTDDFKKACEDNRGFVDQCFMGAKVCDFSLEQWVQLQESIEKSRADIPEYSIYTYFHRQQLGFDSTESWFKELRNLNIASVQKTLRQFQGHKRFRVVCTPNEPQTF